MLKLNKQRIVLVLLTCFCLLSLVTVVYAADQSAFTKLVGPNTTLKLAEAKMKQVGDKLLTFARSLFFGLSILSLAYGLYRSVLSGESNLGSIVAHFAKWMIYVGFFAWMMSSMDSVFFLPKIIVNSFMEAGRAIAGKDIGPDDLLVNGLKMYGKMLEAGWKSTWGNFAGIMIIGGVVLVVLGMLAAIMAVTLIEMHLVVCGGAILLGFAGFEQTREIAFGYIRYSISAGAKILMTMIVYVIAEELLQSWWNILDSVTDFSIILTLSGTILGGTMALLAAAKMVPSMAQSMVNGAISGFGHEMVTGTAAGLGRGAMQAGRTIVNTVRGARNAQTATFRGIASAYDAAKEGGAVGAAGYVAASTPGVRNLVSAAKSGGLRNMAGYVAATALFGSQSERAQKYLSRNEETMTPGNRSMPPVPAPGGTNVSSPESVAERILRS